MIDYTELTNEKMAELIEEICLGSDLKTEDQVTNFIIWVNRVVVDITFLNLLTKKVAKLIDCDENEPMIRLCDEFLEENPQYKSPEDSVIWRQIAETLKNKN